MAYKVFSNGDALTGGELNTFLMNQSVISFASEAARNAALTAPLEGQLVWLEDSNKYVYYSGSAWVDLIVPASSGNAIINGAFDIWQRGTSFSVPSTSYTTDRWIGFANISGDSISQQTFIPGTAPVAGYEGQFYARLTTGAGAGGRFFYQRVEDVRTFAGQTVTFSFWARVSTGTATLNSVVGNQNFGTGGSTFVNGATQANTLTTSWQRFTQTGTYASISGKTIGTGSNIEAAFNTAVAGVSIDIWGVQLESGSTATPFRRNANSIQGELAACQRYYVRYNASASTAFSIFAPSGIATGSTSAICYTTLPVEMRTAPSSVDFGGTLAVETTNTIVNITNLGLGDRRGNKIVSVDYTVASGLTGSTFASVRANNSATAFLGFSAEL